MPTYTGEALRSSKWWMAAVLLWLVPQRASAWTDTQIVSVAAHVDARTDNAQVALELGLRVREGWLSRFELLDLGPELALDEPPQLSFVDGDGNAYTPSVQRLPGNGLALQFADKRSAPHRGDYRLQLSWRARLPPAAAGQQLWSLPRWPERVPNVQVEVLAPLGARPGAGRVHPHDGADFRDLPQAHASVLRFVRAELPRTAGFDVAWTLPAAAPQPVREVREAFWRVLGKRPVALWLGACLSLLCLLKWSWRTREAQPAQSARRSQLQSQWRWRSLGSALGCGLAVALFEALPLWAAALGVISCLWAFDPAVRRSLQRAPAAHGGGHYCLVDEHGCAFLDMTTPSGASFALLICAALCWLRPLAPSTVTCCACLAAALMLGARGGTGAAATSNAPAPTGAPTRGVSRSSSSEARPPRNPDP